MTKIKKNADKLQPQLSTAALKKLGLEFKVSKNDVIEILLAQLREPLEDRLKELEDKIDSIENEIANLQSQFDAKERRALLADHKIVAFKKAAEDLYGVELCIESSSSMWHLAATADKKDEEYYKPRMTHIIYSGPWNGYVKPMNGVPFRLSLGIHKQSWKDTDEAIELYSKLDELTSERKEITYKIREFDLNTSRKARVAVLRKFLTLTPNGEQLLSIIDSRRNGAQIMKALTS